MTERTYTHEERRAAAKAQLKPGTFKRVGHGISQEEFDRRCQLAIAAYNNPAAFADARKDIA